MIVPCKNIPTYNHDTKEWNKTSFNNQLEFAEFLLKECFKEPGEYAFDKNVFEWNNPAKKWLADGKYTDYSETTPEYNEFWDNEELKSRLGVIWKSDNKIWYTTRDYYFLINYCPIINKEQAYKETFATVRDGQYHMMLYEKIAELFDNHSGVLKRRQFLYSYCHVAKSINYLFFENRKRLKWFASDDKYIDDVDGSWSILNQYKTHLNNHTDWQREFSPDKGGEIRQRQQVKTNGKWEWEGNESTIVANTLNKDPKKGVGGPTFWAWYEEGGIAPTADITLQFMEPALTSGLQRVGSFCIGGSVGDLDECKPLEKFIKNPLDYGFFGVPTKWFDETGIEKICGLFIPAQYGMPEATDEFGNSQVELALKLLHQAEFHGFKKGERGFKTDIPAWIKLEPKEYILKKSQNPKNIKEAFAWRNNAEFDTQPIELQERIKIKDKENLWEIKPIKCRLFKDADGKLQYTTKDLSPEIEYPVKPEWTDKRGVVTLYELPKKNAPFWTYFAGVDPVEVGNTTTSKSVFSISIWERAYEEEYLDEDGTIQTRITGDKMVANWRGRFDSTEKTNEYAQMLIQMYNAYTLAERNKPNFINYFERKLLTHLLAKEKEIDIFKDMTNSNRDNSQYGFYKGSNGKAAEVFKQFKKLFKEYFNAEYGTVTTKNKDGEINVKIIKGIDRIPDYWFLEELKLYNDDNLENFDRIISDFAGYYIMKLYSIKNGIHRIKLKKTDVKPKQQNEYLYNFINNQVNTKTYETSSYDFTDY